MRPNSEIDFRNAVDTGEPESGAIIPYTNGEPANQTVLRRPTENNRSRSDVLRSLLRELVILADIDRNPIAYGGGTVTWGGAKATDTGVFTITSDLIVTPAATPGGGPSIPYVESTNAVLSVGTPSTNELIFTSKFRQWEQTGADPDINKDTNKISIEIQDTGSLSVTVNGATGEENNILIGIDFGTTTCQNVIDEIVATSAAAALVTATLGSGTLGSATSPKFSEAEWGTDFSARFLRGGAGGIAHVITAANLAAFFSAHAENPLEKGDTLAIWYDQLIDIATDGGRFQSVPENTNITIPSGALFNTRREPEKIPNCIPICKCLDQNTIQFINGAIIIKGTPANLWMDSYAFIYGETALLSTPLGWSRMHTGTVWNPPSTLRHALDNADGHIHNILTEIETARTSSSYGAYGSLDARLEPSEAEVVAARSTDHTDVPASGFASLDARLDKHGGHVSGWYSLGPGGSNAMYTNLKTCLTDVIAAGGGTIFVQAPVTYAINSSADDLPEITAPIRIIGKSSNALTITSNRGADTRNVLGFVLRIDANHCHFENVVIVNGASGSNWAVLLDGALTTSFRNCGFQGGVVVAGNTRQVTFDHCSFVEPGNASGEENFGLLMVSDGLNTSYYPSGITGTPSDVTVRNCEFDGSGGSGIGLIVSGPSLVYYDVTQDIPNLVVARGLYMRDCYMTAANGYGSIRTSAGQYNPSCSFDNIEIYTEGANNDAPCVTLSDQNVSVKNMTIVVYGNPASARLGQGLFYIGSDTVPYGRSCVADGVHIETRGVVPTATIALVYIQGGATVRDLDMDITMPDATNHAATERSTTAPLIRMASGVRAEPTLKDSYIKLYSKSTPGIIPGLVCGDVGDQLSLGAMVLDNVVFDSQNISGVTAPATAVTFYFVAQVPDNTQIKNCRFRLGAHGALALVRFRANGVQIEGNTFMTADMYLNGGAHVMMDSSGGTLQVGNGAVIKGNQFFHSYPFKIYFICPNTYEPRGIVIADNVLGNTGYQAGWGMWISEVEGATIIGNNCFNHSAGSANIASSTTVPVLASFGTLNIDQGNVGAINLPTN